MTRVYKVVRRAPQGLFSATVLARQYRFACVRYEPGKWTRPRIGKLFAFETLESAQRFCRDLLARQRYEIWEAEAENSRNREFMCIILHLTKRALLKFWKKPGAVPTGLYAPGGTVLCDAIKLVRRVAVV